MNDNLKHLVLEMSVGMFAYVLFLGILALLFQNGLADWILRPKTKSRTVTAARTLRKNST